MNTTANPPPALTGPIEDAFSGRIFVSDSIRRPRSRRDVCGDCGSTPVRGRTPSVYPCWHRYNTDHGGKNSRSAGGGLVARYRISVRGRRQPHRQCLRGSSSTFEPPGICGTGEPPWARPRFRELRTRHGGGTGTALHSGDFDNNYYSSDGLNRASLGSCMFARSIPLERLVGSREWRQHRHSEVTFDTNGDDQQGQCGVPSRSRPTPTMSVRR